MGIVSGKEFRRGDHRECFLVMGRFSEQVIQKNGPFVPPVAVQFGIIGAEDNGFSTHYTAEMFDLFFAIEHKVGGMFGGAFAGKVRAVRLFMGSASGDAVVLQARELPHAIGLDVGADVVVIEVETAVAVEVAVFAIPWVTLLRTPDLFAGFNITSKCGGT